VYRHLFLPQQDLHNRTTSAAAVEVNGEVVSVGLQDGLSHGIHAVSGVQLEQEGVFHATHTPHQQLVSLK